MDRDLLLANLEWLNSTAPEPAEELSPLGECAMTGAEMLQGISKGQLVVISRRYLRDIIAQLKS